MKSLEALVTFTEEIPFYALSFSNLEESLSGGF